ncbi:DUF3196 family protein [Bacillaceae bacterium S4-13-58]
MSEHDEDVVLFPKWRKSLEEEGFKALEEKRYKDALESFEQLLSFRIDSHDLLMGVLICKTELGEHEDALEICSRLMKEAEEEQYYQYLHIYIMILFQMGQYSELLDLLEEIFKEKNIPTPTRQQLFQMYEASRQLNLQQRDQNREKGEKEFTQAFQTEDPHHHWRILQWMKNHDLYPPKEKIKPILENPTIHPVVKTRLLDWLSEDYIDQNFTIQKFMNTTTINPAHSGVFAENQKVKTIFKQLESMEQKDPTLYDFCKKVIYRYLYVVYPFLPIEGEVQELIDAVIIYSKSTLYGDGISRDVESENNFFGLLQQMEKIYLSIIDE